MAVNASSETRGFRFGVFELDTQSGELRKSGFKLHLQEQPTQLLALLLSRPGEIVSRDELRENLWPDGTFVDFDHSLNTAVNKLRETLGDSASSPRFIETVPRHGYRFVAPVEPIGNAASASAPRSRWRYGKLLLVALALPVLATVIWLAAGRSDGPPTILVPVPLTTYPGEERYPSFSPDGNQVAFSWTGRAGGNSDIYVNVIGAEQPLRLTTSPADDQQPAWSPDGRHIAFLRFEGQGADVYLISPLGGPERKVAHIHIHQPLQLGYLGFTALSWLPDSSGLILAGLQETPHRRALFSLKLSTGDKEQLTFPPAEQEDGDPVVSPDGRSLAFVRATTGSTAALLVLPLDGEFKPASEPRRLPVNPGYAVRTPVWSGDGRYLHFGAGPQHSLRLFRTRADGTGGPQLTSSGGEKCMELAASRAKSRLAYSKNLFDPNIWRTVIGADPTSHRTSGFIVSSSLDHLPAYSPDGNRVAFITNRSGFTELWVVKRDGSVPARLTFFEGSVLDFPRWSPDSRQIVFAATIGERKAIHLIDAQGGVPRPLLEDKDSQESPSFSRDGKWIYFSSDRSGRNEIWKIPRHGGVPSQVTRNEGGVPLESRDGRFLYYTKQVLGSGIWRMPAAGGEETRIITSVANNGSFDLSERGIYFIPDRDEKGRTSLSYYEFATRSTRVIHHIEKPIAWGLSVSPDGREVLYTQADNYGSDLMLVENFR
jgi:Tol biopolymer transport system component/DNA-binding winged helix-turn-helix (wHTH) protein